MRASRKPKAAQCLVRLSIVLPTIGPIGFVSTSLRSQRASVSSSQWKRDAPALFTGSRRPISISPSPPAG
jgi:hypothetical protein